VVGGGGGSEGAGAGEGVEQKPALAWWEKAGPGGGSRGGGCGVGMHEGGSGRDSEREEGCEWYTGACEHTVKEGVGRPRAPPPWGWQKGRL
jgi:hypothetical protein